MRETEEIVEAAGSAAWHMLPPKSKELYDKTYNYFREWCEKKKLQTYTEHVLLQYFTEKAKEYKSSTLWVQYSMIKACLIVYENINISTYRKLMAFLKTNSDGFTPKQTKTFTRDEISTFLREANDNEYLMMKVALIIGIAGACRTDELTNLTVDDIEDVGSSLIIRTPKINSKISRKFVVSKNGGNIDIIDILSIYRKYAALRPNNTGHRRFFLFYKAGKCSKQPVGKNTIGKLPSLVATYLGLPDPNAYTGRCLRNTSATLGQTIRKRQFMADITKKL